MPDSFNAYDNLTVAEYVDFFARAHGFTRADRRSRVEEILSFTGLDKLADRLANKMSKGQTQRLCLCRALLHDPRVLILDEPAAGLDPQARVELKQLIRILSEEGRTLLISSHILSELGEMCDRLVFINQGKLLHDGASEDLLRGDEGKTLVEISVVPGSGDPSDTLELQPGVEVIESLRNGVRVALDDGMQRLGPVVALAMLAIEIETQQGRVDAALARLDRLAERSPRQATWLNRRGEILERAGRREEARASYARVLAELDTLPVHRRRSPAMRQLEAQARERHDRLVRTAE